MLCSPPPGSSQTLSLLDLQEPHFARRWRAKESLLTVERLNLKKREGRRQCCVPHLQGPHRPSVCLTSTSPLPTKMECERVTERFSLTSEFILVLWACSIHLFLGSTEVYLPREQPAYVTGAERVAFIYFWGLRRSIFLVNNFPHWSSAPPKDFPSLVFNFGIIS